MNTTASPKYLQFATIGKQVLNLIHHFQSYELAFDQGERFLIEDDDIVADIMKLLTAKNSAGFDRMATLYFNDDQSFSGIVEDFVSIRLTKRYAFRANDTTLQYRLINPADVENFSEAESVDFATKNTGKKKQAQCVKGVPCEPICLRATYVCLHDFNEPQKKILKSAQAKALRLKAKAELKGEKVIDYDIDRSDPKATAKLGQQFISHYISTSNKSARELELEAKLKQIKKDIANAKKKGKYNPKELIAEEIAVTTEHKALVKERTTCLEDELFVLRKALIAHQGIPDGILEGLATRLKFADSVYAAKVDNIKDDLKGFYALTGMAGHENLRTIELTNKLASSNLKEGTLNVGGYVTDDRLWNQAARHWEYASPELNKAATEWRNQRATSPNPVKLNSLVKNGGYRDDEVALSGNYLDPYLGKVHGVAGSPTEVLAMGLERLSNHKRMAALYKKDPEFLEFLVGTLVANKNAPAPTIEPKKPESKKAEIKK